MSMFKFFIKKQKMTSPFLFLLLFCVNFSFPVYAQRLVVGSHSSESGLSPSQNNPELQVSQDASKTPMIEVCEEKKEMIRFQKSQAKVVTKSWKTFCGRLTDQGDFFRVEPWVVIYRVSLISRAPMVTQFTTRIENTLSENTICQALGLGNYRVSSATNVAAQSAYYGNLNELRMGFGGNSIQAYQSIECEK